MKTIRLICILFFLTGISTALASQPIALLKKTIGEVTVVRKQTSLKASAGMHLLNGDRLKVAQNGYAGIIFTDGTLMTFGPETDIRIDTYLFEPEHKAYDFSMYIEKGSVVYTSGKMGKLSPESVKLNTPKTMIGVRGTRFIVNVD